MSSTAKAREPAASHIAYDGGSFGRRDGESVLDALLRGGQAIPHSCKAGACQSCLMEMTEGTPEPAAQSGLKPSYAARNFFLACRCHPAEDVAVRLPDASEASVEAVLAERRMLSGGVAALWLKLEGDAAEFRPGQYVTLERPEDGLARSYSIANLPDADGRLELHVRRIPDGAMSGWLYRIEPGERLRVRGPAGDCFYLPGEAQDFPILLAGTGTGLAPLLGVARDALRQGHAGPILLFHGGRDADALYQLEELRALRRGYGNLDCRFSVLDLERDADDMAAGAIQDHVAAALPGLDLKRTQAFFCGAPELVSKLKMAAFMAGVGSQAIHTDPFLPTAD